MTNTQDDLQRIYAQLLGLRKNLPEIHPNNNMDWPQVRLYIDLLDKLEKIGINMSDFRIPPELLNNNVVLGNYVTREMVDTGNPKVTEGYLKSKLDALLTYFEISTAKEKTTIGFRLPDEE